jgi:Zn-dependent protease
MFDLTLATLISRLVILAVAFSVHEFAHAWMAVYFGDETPRMQGRLTLNPLAHLDPIGSLMLLVAGFGWAKPVQVNPYALMRSSANAMMLVALAGPVSNFLLALFGSIPFQTGVLAWNGARGAIFPTASQFLSEFVFINLLLTFFNLIPLFPLDGEKILMHFLPPDGQRVMDRIRPYSTFILLGLVFILPQLGLDVLGWLILTPTRFFLNLFVF